jgi:hypothetical protein
MSVKIVNVAHPKTGICSSCILRPDGLYEFADGTVVHDDDLRPADRPAHSLGQGIITSLVVIFLGSLAFELLLKWLCS